MDSTTILVLNHNGQHLLAECLPSVLRAAAESRHDCRVAVVDNASTDGSLELLHDHFPKVPVWQRPNRGLCSYNDVLAEIDDRVAVLLNNDIKLHRQSIDPLVAPWLGHGAETQSRCFLAAPLCWRFDGYSYDGQRTAVRWRFGLVQATALFTGHEPLIHTPGYTASAGAAVAVDREKFLQLGGFDARYLPGRIEDLDFAFRGYQAGYVALYVPQSVAYHRGGASFERAYGRAGCDSLALRNTLLFQWKNLRHPLHRAQAAAGAAVRLAADVVRAPWIPAPRRWAFIRAWHEARTLARQYAPCVGNVRGGWRAEREFFRRFHPRAMSLEEAQRDTRYPLSRWYVRPAAAWLAASLSRSQVRPVHLTLLGLLSASTAAGVLWWQPDARLLPALLVLLAWLFDRADGQLARRQHTATRFGAWLDANVDELTDLVLHTALAAAAACTSATVWPWTWLLAFLFGKYLFMHGLATEPAAPEHERVEGASVAVRRNRGGWLRRIYHLPANADVRLHMVILALATNCLVIELAVVAIYYNLRWIARYGLVARRLRGLPA